MANFIEVVESRYGMKLLLNIDNIVAVQEGSDTVFTNAVHGEQHGMFSFDSENMQKIVEAVNLSIEVNRPCSAHRIVGCTKH